MSNAGVGKIFINTEEITFNKAFRIRADLKVDVKIKKKTRSLTCHLLTLTLSQVRMKEHRQENSMKM